MLFGSSSNIQTLIDCFTEGILMFGPENKIIVNDAFAQLFDIDKESTSDVLEVLIRYGIDENLSSDLKDEMAMCIKGREIKAKNIVLKSSDEEIYTIYIFKESQDGKACSKMDELIHSIDAMKDIIDNAYQGMVLVDKNGRIIKWGYEKLLGIKEEEVIGKPVEEVIENTRLHIVLKTGEKELCDVQRVQGRDMLANRIPIIKDGEVIGAAGTVLFRSIEEIRSMAKKLEALEKTVSKYKNEISKMYRARYTFDSIIGQNKQMLELKELAAKAAVTDSTVLIQGESGTGKEYFAHAIHNASNRRYGPFVQINCAAIPHELLESELFGYEGGAFTGAKREGKIGKLELANGGTILMDEISSMPYSMQAKLLRVLEEREFERIGGNNRIRMDVRIIACTNENLQEAVKQGKFRHDLFYRLNVVELNIPPLRDRLDDIPLLCENILDKLALTIGISRKTITNNAMKALTLYNWPGNVRELRNVLERAANMSAGNIITLENLPDYINNSLANNYINIDKSCLKDRVINTELNAILDALKASNGSRTEAAKLLGIHRTALYKKLRNYGINIKSL